MHQTLCSNHECVSNIAIPAHAGRRSARLLQGQFSRLSWFSGRAFRQAGNHSNHQRYRRPPLPSENYDGVRYPHLLIAFNADPVANISRHGYLIPEQGKPPDFVLEVASESTGRRDEVTKRSDYQRMGILENWRFDPSGGCFHQTH